QEEMGGKPLSTLICLLIVYLVLKGYYTEDLKAIRQFIKHHETLSYHRNTVLRQHERVRRHTEPQTQVVRLDFEAFQRVFRLRLKQDFGAFAEDLKVFFGNESWTGDLSHIYSGVLEDENGSSCQGAILDGLFEGFIKTSNGTFYVEALQTYGTGHLDHHSIVYHEDDVDGTLLGGGHAGFCGTDALQSLIQGLKQVASYMKAINNIYHKADFDGIDLINFKVKSMSIVLEEDPGDPLQETYIGPEKLLSLFSEMNWGNYCLSYLLTNRDFSGVLGLAWEGKADDWGGICSKHIQLKDGRTSSMNTGLVTLKNFGRYLPPKFVQLTLAHELGHSLGAPHDEGLDCGSLEITGGKGRFLMFPQATDVVQENSDMFSPCSLRHMGHLLKIKKDKCFVVSDQPICGNRILEKGEECDVGHNESDPCCYSSKAPIGTQCHLKPSKQCSPSQGLCCSSTCIFKNSGLTCEEDSECRMKSVCTGLSAVCPKPAAKPNMTVCSLGTRVCHNGDCARSLCVTYGLEQCDCPGENRKEKCHMCCQHTGNPNTCASTTSSVLSTYFKGKRVALVPGSPCSKNQGYCDHFQTCRLLDADGPIARLKNSFLHLNEFIDLADWMK
ncbi:hypothetical protein P4O66_013107, partial [Electrophorus voltai]